MTTEDLQHLVLLLQAVTAIRDYPKLKPLHDEIVAELEAFANPQATEEDTETEEETSDAA